MKMTNQHPITPPPELVREWQREANHNEAMFPQVATFAARWGADQELEACCEYLKRWEPEDVTEFCDLRRPKPPSLKEQALEVVTGLEKRWDLQCDLTLLRRALEALPND